MHVRFDTPATRLLDIDVPIIQGAMAWLSEAEMVAAVCNEGGMGFLGASVMSADEFEPHVRRCSELTDRPFGVNFPLVLGDYEKHLEMCLSYGVKVICVSAGSPKVLTPKIKAAGAVSLHVVPNLRLAQKAAAAGVDGLVLESYEAGGHVSSDQITAFTNIPLISRNVDLPIIAAGGIADGYGMAAAMALGADAVQLGTRFLATFENNANDLYKMLVVNAGENDAPVYSLDYHPGRALRSPFINKILELEQKGAPSAEIRKLIGRGRAKLAAHEANFDEGMFYSGASACLVDELLSVHEVFKKMLSQYQEVVSDLSNQVVSKPAKAPLRVIDGSSTVNE